MDRLRLDQAGARRGELFQHSLQMGDDTVTVGNIATMAIERETFQPYQTPGNRRRLGLHVGLSLTFLFIAAIALAVWFFTPGGLLRASGLIGWLSAILFIVFTVLATRFSLMMKRVETFFRLRIGASDGRQIDLVDNSRPTLEKIRDAIRMKIDSNDYSVTGTFDLDLDEVRLETPEVVSAVTPGRSGV